MCLIQYTSFLHAGKLQNINDGLYRLKIDLKHIIRFYYFILPTSISILVRAVDEGYTPYTHLLESCVVVYLPLESVYSHFNENFLSNKHYMHFLFTAIPLI